MINKAKNLRRTLNAETAKGKGAESVLHARNQLTQDLLQGKQQLKGMIDNLTIKNTPSTTEKYHELKQLLNYVQEVLIELDSLPKTSHKSAKFKRP